MKNIYDDNQPDEEKTPDMENTLDYYNDSISRKAVGKLFQGHSVGEDTEEDIDIEDIDQPDQPDQPLSQPPSTKRKPIHLGVAGETTEEEYDFSMFKAKEKRARSNLITEDLPDEEVTIEDEGIYEKPLAKNKEKLKLTAKSDEEELELHERSPKNRPKERTLYYRRNIYDDEQDDAEEVSSKGKPATIIIGIGFVILLMVLAFLIFQINKVKAENVTFTQDIAEAKSMKEKYQQLEMDHLKLQGDYTNVESQLETFRLQQNQQSQVQSNPQDLPDHPTQNPTQDLPQTPNTTEGKPKTHTVVKGDKLAAISKKYYGNESDYKKIVEANNLKTETIFVGQELIIP